MFGKVVNDRYKLQTQIDAGGQGLVWVAQDTHNSRRVVLKQLSLAAKKRFEREIENISQLNHPHIITIYDHFEEDGIWYMVMPYAIYGSLRHWLKQAGKLTVADVIQLGVAMAQALEVAHQQGIVHRDMKPDNILLMGDGIRGEKTNPVLADFGVLHLRDAAQKLTKTGALVGTIPYMSPEQLHGKPVDSKTDVYALAAVLYEALTGQHYLYTGNSQEEMMRRIFEETPKPVHEVRSDVPQWLSDLLAQALHKTATRRPTAKVFAQKLKFAGQKLPVEATFLDVVGLSIQHPRQLRQWLGLGASTVALSVVTTLMVLWLYLAAMFGPNIAWQVMPGNSPTIEAATEQVEIFVDEASQRLPNATSEAAEAFISNAVVQGATAYGGLSLRNEPNRNATAINRLEDGTELMLLGYSDDTEWAKVRTATGEEGWVFHTPYLSEQQAAVAP